MITNEQKIRLGIFLATTLFLLLAIAAVLIMPQLKQEGDVYHIDFRGMSVNGVNEGADVKYLGVRIGKVTELEVHPEDLDSVRVFIKIEKNFPVKQNMRATLQYAGITGLRFVEISGGRSDAPFLQPGQRIRAGKGLGEKAEDIVLNIDSVVEAVNDMLDKKNRENFARLLENLDKSTAVIADSLGKRQESLENTIKNIETITNQLKDTVAGLNRFTQYLDKFTERVSPTRLEEMVAHTDEMIVNITKRFSKEEFGGVIDSVDEFAGTANISLKKIDNRFQDLQDELSRTLTALRESMENIARFSRDLREDPTMLIRTRAAKRRRK